MLERPRDLLQWFLGWWLNTSAWEYCSDERWYSSQWQYSGASSTTTARSVQESTELHVVTLRDWLLPGTYMEHTTYRGCSFTTGHLFNHFKSHVIETSGYFYRIMRSKEKSCWNAWKNQIIYLTMPEASYLLFLKYTWFFSVAKSTEICEK